MIKKIHIFVKNRGVLGLILLLFNKLYFLCIRSKFKQCGGLYLERPFKIAGYENISIGVNFKAGPGLKLEAINSYKGFTFTPSVVIGDNVIINDYVHIACVNKIVIGNNVLMASKIFISDHNHGYYDDLHKAEQEDPNKPPVLRKLTRDSYVVIEDDVWIGEFVSILPGVNIGRGAILGCNSVVSRDVPAYTIVAGVPAKPVKRYDFENKCWVKY